MVITKIEPQKKNSLRVSIYLDDKYAFGIHDETLLKFGLRRNDQLDEKKIEEITAFEEVLNVREKAMRFLSYRARSEKEIRDKLKKKKFSEELIDTVIQKLQLAGLINDLEFGRMFARDKMGKKPMGRIMLKQELLRKGITNHLIEQILSEVYPNHGEDEFALTLARKRLQRYKSSFAKLDTFKRKKKLADYLARRGFDWDTISKVVGTLLNSSSKNK